MNTTPDDEQASAAFVDSSVPLYYQLATILRENIISGRFAVGDKFPTEADLVKLYSVSRATVRGALQSLKDEGLIRREAGRGTFVSGMPEFVGTLKMDGTLNGLIAMGLATSPRLVDLQEVTVTPQQAESLGMETGTPAIRACRVRYYKGHPYCYIINTLPLAVGRMISDADWESGSILRHLQTDHDLELGDADEYVRATVADATLARWLQVRIGAPLLQVEYLIRDAAGNPVETPVIFYRSDMHAFTLRLTWSSGGPKETKGWSLRAEE
ncbi:MAG: GntR family transcriptional regulator [Thermoanaerobaculales bacterium]|nr:GntR family transcriptional regulator [Thermoanaerobaculales bacterium]